MDRPFKIQGYFHLINNFSQPLASHQHKNPYADAYVSEGAKSTHLHRF